MIPRMLDPQSLGAIRGLVSTNYRGRNELTAAAEVIDDKTQEGVCRRLADVLGGHAADLQQVLIACGEPPVNITEIEPARELQLFDIAKRNGGDGQVIRAVENCEQAVKRDYRVAVENIANAEARRMMQRQISDVELSVHVLQSMRLAVS